MNNRERKDYDDLVRNLNITSSIIFYTYSLDRNKLTALIRKDNNLYTTMDFNISYIKDTALDMRVKNPDSFLENIIDDIGRLRINGKFLGDPDYRGYVADDKDTKAFGWDLSNGYEKKKGTK